MCVDLWGSQINGWRVYDDPELSDKIYEEILAAREKVQFLLREKRPEDILFAI